MSGVADLDIMADVWNALDSALANGEALGDFKTRVGQLLESQWGGEIPNRLDTIFRTNVQSAYSAGRYAFNNRPDVKSTHPYSRFVANLDERTTTLCRHLHGTVLPSDHPFWASHQPPLHFQCRSDVVAISEEDAQGFGISEKPPEAEPDEGFGNPTIEWLPDVSTRPPELQSIYFQNPSE